tara:strand:+ start:136 stop:468 length:333 start_codon:yes stop_codon:yes gene_type:complete
MFKIINKMKKFIIYSVILVLLPLATIANDCNYSMTDTQMTKIIQSMNNQSEEIKKLNVIKMYLQRLCINTSQMTSIMQVFDSKDIKNQFFLYSKEYITDQENYQKIKLTN